MALFTLRKLFQGASFDYPQHDFMEKQEKIIQNTPPEEFLCNYYNTEFVYITGIEAVKKESKKLKYSMEVQHVVSFSMKYCHEFNSCAAGPAFANSVDPDQLASPEAN